MDKSDRGNYLIVRSSDVARSNLSFMPISIAVRNKVMMLDAMIGDSRRMMPYASHPKMPHMNVTSIGSDRSRVERVRHVRHTCGTNAAVVSSPATAPIQNVIARV